MWAVPESKGITLTTPVEAERLKLISEGCNPKTVSNFVFDRFKFVGIHSFFYVTCQIAYAL